MPICTVVRAQFHASFHPRAHSWERRRSVRFQVPLPRWRTSWMAQQGRAGDAGQPWPTTISGSWSHNPRCTSNEPDVLVIATAGGRRDQENPRPVPHTHGFQLSVLSNGCCRASTCSSPIAAMARKPAMSSGIPLVHGGLTEDKADVNRALRGPASASSLATQRADARALRDAVRTVLDRPAIASASREWLNECAGIDSRSRCSDHHPPCCDLRRPRRTRRGTVRDRLLPVEFARPGEEGSAPPRLRGTIESILACRSIPLRRLHPAAVSFSRPFHIPASTSTCRRWPRPVRAGSSQAMSASR